MEAGALAATSVGQVSEYKPIKATRVKPTVTINLSSLPDVLALKLAHLDRDGDGEINAAEIEFLDQREKMQTSMISTYRWIIMGGAGIWLLSLLAIWAVAYAANVQTRTTEVNNNYQMTTPSGDAIQVSSSDYCKNGNGALYARYADGTCPEGSSRRMLEEATDPTQVLQVANSDFCTIDNILIQRNDDGSCPSSDADYSPASIIKTAPAPFDSFPLSSDLVDAAFSAMESVDLPSVNGGVVHLKLSGFIRLPSNDVVLLTSIGSILLQGMNILTTDDTQHHYFEKAGFTETHKFSLLGIWETSVTHRSLDTSPTERLEGVATPAPKAAGGAGNGYYGAPGTATPTTRAPVMTR